MIADLVDRFDRLPDWSRRVLGIVGAAWMVVTALDYGRIIDLPEIPVLTGTAGIILAGLYNAVWWGFINPRIEQHRAARCSAAEAKVTVNG